MTPDPSTGQILPGSKFGDKLTELAREAKVIVEIGTWKGGGSTQCLINGMDTCGHFLITIEANDALHSEARERLERWERVWPVWGTIIRPEEFPDFWHTLPDREASYNLDKAACGHAPYCLPIIPPKIDLLLLDGGEWTSHVEYLKLKDRCKVIALDDTNEEDSIKNYQARSDMIESGWTVLADEPDDRNGWFIGRRP